jgi:PQQ-dependent dehydrogenase (methanol/ethanol family)
MQFARIFALLALLGIAACDRTDHSDTGQRIVAADREAGSWLSYGRTYSEQRFSPLKQIDRSNVARLGLAWSYETRETRGAEGTPLMVDGVLYFTSAWSIVYAVDAATGKELWVYDPEVDRSRGSQGCCDAVNRGVAFWNGKIYVGTFDGRLVAIDAKTGKKVWQTQTFDLDSSYTITGAPRAAKGLVFIGNGGAEYGVRGYVSAYEAETGRLKWRFYTVPGDPAKGPDHAASDPQIAMMRKTWDDKGQYWKVGGGGTVWDSIVYDPELDQLYIGVGNGSPWDRSIRSPSGGDNLFLASIVAVKPETGKYLWHYQTTPGEQWDYTATQPIMLADLKIGGQDRKVLMQAPKNGFFYVIDRTSGRLISAKNLIAMAKDDGVPNKPMSWAYGIDMTTGRPLENARARYSTENVSIRPGPSGVHNWQPMAYSPQTGLVYLPIQDPPSDYVSEKPFVYRKGFRNTGVPGLPVVDSRFGAASMPRPKGYLIAWDPIEQKEVWRVTLPSVMNGGAVVTAGGLVFEGGMDGKFTAYDAATGKLLWSHDLIGVAYSGPITYAIGEKQYVGVLSSFGGLLYLGGGFLTVAPGMPINSRLNVFTLDGKAALPAMQRPAVDTTPPPKPTASADVVAKGAQHYANFCQNCHGVGVWSANVLPELRRSPVVRDPKAFELVVTGALKQNGMPDFSSVTTREDREAIRAYVIRRANYLYDTEHAKRAATR